ncbi:ubiquitin elongating factor core-domain-containing protein [Kockovaella imperatae]|uniref:RING-type E3 ubiquitin transferase n=1 Tax=Kockovaella imperatae TaxID=4999 RepID=A0A1Y1UCM9_9TREE|nr:ubiquitin elongating factor core-domain-containing protein [Kockovaella imperatae]ORX35769.1 ubiquitin elongating factor core-domain-containing protein [Kockovaella imperatae]
MSGDSEMSDAEKIRLRRLARLGNPGTPKASQPSEPPAQSSASHTPREVSTAPGSSPSLSSAPPIPSPNPQPAQIKSRNDVRSTDAIRKPAPRTIPYTEWLERHLSLIFAVTLEKAKASNGNLCWLKDLYEELREENTMPTMSMSLVDRILIARLSMDTQSMALSDDVDKLAIVASLPEAETVFEYLVGCWKRLAQSSRNLSSLDETGKIEWQKDHERLKQLIMSYTSMTLEDPTMFPQPSDRLTGPAEFLPILLDLDSSDHVLNSNELVPFLNDLAVAAEDSLSEVLTPTLSLFFQEWFKIVPTPDLMGADWRRYLGAIATLVRSKHIAATLPTLPIWRASAVSAHTLEWQSLLGPLLRLSVYPREFPEIWRTYFSNPTERKTDDINANKSNLRFTLRSVQTDLFTIFNAIIRSSPSAREAILDYISCAITLNSKRAGMRVDSRTVASDGFMSNILSITLKLLEPAMDLSFTKISKIDTNCSRTKPVTDEETRIHAAKEDVDKYSAEDAQGPNPNSNPFITDLFHSAAALQHLGLVKTISSRIRGEKNMSDMEKELKRTEASRGEWEGNATLQAQGDAAIAKLRADIATLHATIHAYDTQLLEPAFVRSNIDFCSLMMTWLLRQVDPKQNYPASPIKLPLPSQAPIHFRVIPEYFLDNITEYFDFLTRYDPERLEDHEKDIFITFALAFLSPGYINNPFLKAKLVSILSNGLYSSAHHRKGIFFDRLSLHSISSEYLMPSIIRFFIEVESTGGHTQFWDKFNFRRDMSHIFRSLWDSPLFRASFVKSRHDDFDQFIKFINMLMSDTTFHLEESLTNLTKINAIQTQQADEASWSQLPKEERDDLVSQMRQAESSAPYHTVMGLDHVELIRDFTATTKEPFVTAEIVDRLVASLDENLATLVGPKMQELNLANADRERLSFKPKRLLAGIAQIYLNLAGEADFVRAVANDGRSYSRELFERFARILKHRAIMTEAEVQEVVAFTQKVEDMKATIMIEDEREIPDEFLDPLLSTLMKDPVILPMSRVVVDRGTIRTVLLSKEVDPFNNMPLKYEDCIPDTELKAKIAAWIAEGKTNASGDVMEVDNL